MSARSASRREGPRPGLGDHGGSVIEMLVASAILVLMAVPIFALFEGGTRIFARGDAAAGLHQDLRATVDRMMRDLRMAGYDPSATGSPAAFEVATATTVRFLADADLDGTTDRIEYAYVAPERTITRQFWRWSGGWGPGSGALVVARNVDGLALSYFNATDGAAATLGDIRRVAISITGSDVAAGATDGRERFTVASDARPRNLP